jgi:transcriptional regulator GlxA family with amidase domain
MYANIEDPLSLDDIAEQGGLSRRQLERHFRNLLLEPPAVIYRNIRLERARGLMIETDMSVMEVAMACGFNSANVFSRHFKKRYGETPFGVRGKRSV